MKNQQKDYANWTPRKANIHNGNQKPPTFNEREVWWTAVGENIGVEINGKGASFSRPVIIYKKLSQHSLLAIPLSTVIKQGSWYVHFNLKKINECANLAQIKVISSKRLYNKIGNMTPPDFQTVKTAFYNLYG